MAIVKMKKLTLAAPQDERDEILNLLQAEGSVQLINLKDKADELDCVDFFKETKSAAQAEADYNHIKFAYGFLNQYTSRKKGLFEKREVISKKDFNGLESRIKWEDIYDRCREIDEKINLIKNEKSKLISSLGQYEDWTGLDISDSDINSLKKASCSIGTVDKRYQIELIEELNNAFEDIYIEKISEGKQNINLVLLYHVDDSQSVLDILKKYGFTKVNMDLEAPPAEQASKIRSRIEKLDEEFNALTEKAKTLSDRIADIEKVYDYISNRLEKEIAISNLLKTKKTFMLEGWIPDSAVDRLEKSLEKRFDDFYLDFQESAEEDAPPVMLRNNKLFEPFEVITSMYALPLPTEVDPTPILAPFYLIFFGMMAGDIGYGLVLLIATSVALKFMDVQGDTKKIIKLLFYCSIPTIIFGWVFGGFFGNAVPVKPLWLNPVDKPMDVLYLSVALGVVHLFTGLGVKAYSLIKKGQVLDAIYDVFFWYALVGGLLYLLVGSSTGIGGTEIAKYVAIAGAVGLLLTQGRANESIAGKFFGGVYGLYGVTSYIGDILSYSRLLALGLATSLIGSSFNLLIKLLGGGAAALIAGPLIFIAGHTFNILIGMLGTFVHTCRLEYLEFFGKFYEGGGSAFNPLNIRTKFIKVNTEK